MTRRSFARKREHSHARFSPQQGATRVGGSYGDLGKFRRARLDHHSAIRINHRAIMADRWIAQGHQEETGNQLESWPHANAMQRRAHRMRGRVGCAGNRSIGASSADHQVSVIQGIAQRSARLIDGHTFGAAPLIKQRYHLVKVAGVEMID